MTRKRTWSGRGFSLPFAQPREIGAANSRRAASKSWTKSNASEPRSRSPNTAGPLLDWCRLLPNAARSAVRFGVWCSASAISWLQSTCRGVTMPPILLDTHAAIWSAKWNDEGSRSTPHRCGRRARRALALAHKRLGNRLACRQKEVGALLKRLRLRSRPLWETGSCDSRPIARNRHRGSNPLGGISRRSGRSNHRCYGKRLWSTAHYSR